MSIFKRIASMLALSTLITLVACGGGGGSAGSSGFGPGNGSGGTGGTGGTGGGTVTAPTLELSVNPTTVTAAVPGIVSARVTAATGSPIAGQVVQFSTASGLGRFSAPSALTGADGVATVTVSPTSASTTGADEVTALTTVNGTALSARRGFQLTATDVSVASFTSDLGTTALQPYGQTSLTVALSAGAVGTPVNVSVSSSCVTRNLATLTPATATTSTGTATFTFRDNGCGADGRDSLQASVTGTSSTRALQINLAAPTVASISFISASPDTIFLRGSGFVENSTVTFKVQDAAGNGVRGQSVLLEPTTLAGGLKVDDLGSQSDFPLSKLSDANGNVIVRINSGTVPTPVRIRARMTVGGSEVATVSSTLAIAVGLPSQLNFSLSQGTRNIEGQSVDGTSNTYTLIASDRLGNPVPDGTAINFVAEGGQVQAIRLTQTNGGLSRAVANFQSSSPRPADGRVTILAYALGEESFLDENGDNIYTTGERYQDLGDPFLDRLYTGDYNAATDQFIAQTPTASSACVASPSPLLALDRSMPVRPTTCSQTWGRSYVRRAIETVFSTSAARPVWGTSLPFGAVLPVGLSCPAGISLVKDNADATAPAYAADGTPQLRNYFPVGSTDLLVGKSGAISFVASDANPTAYNPVAAGTTVSVSGTDGLTVAVVGGSPVPSTTAPTGVTITYSFNDTTFSGTITITLRSPGGLATTLAQSVSRSAFDSTTQVRCP